MTDDATPEPTGPEGSPHLARFVLVLLIAGALALAFGREQHVAASTQEQVQTGALTMDVLTGRRLGPDGRPLTPTSGPGSADQPLRLRFVPSGDKKESGTAIGDMVAWLERRTGYEIEGAILRNYTLVIEELVSGASDVAFLTAASYARAYFATNNNSDPGDDIEAILQVRRQGDPKYPGSHLAYRAAFIVRNDSPLQTLADITNNHKIAMGNVTSGASSILPSARLNQLGVSPQVGRYSAYPLIVRAVLDGAADIGCVWWSPPNEEEPINDGRIMALRTSPDVLDQTRIIGYTGWIPNEPVAVRKALPTRIKETLARALTLYVEEKSATPEGRKELLQIGSIESYLPASNADFAALIETIENAFANDPEGWKLFQKGRGK